MSQVVEQNIDCPFCGEPVTVLLDLSAGGQSYIEDCEVCCRPMQIAFVVDNDEIADVRVSCAS